MRISGIHNIQTFKGYDARPLKALYMQKSGIEGQDEIYNELYEIGQKAGFNVYMNYAGRELAKTPKEVSETKGHEYDICWAQDSKTFVCVDGKVHILYPSTCKNYSNEEAVNLADKLDIPRKMSSVWFEGGNTFIGTKDSGENYVLVGENTFTAYDNIHRLDESKMKQAIRKYIEEGSLENVDEREKNDIERIMEGLANEFHVKKRKYFCHETARLSP